MSTADSIPTPLGRPSQAGEPAWEIAHLFPLQGDWTEAAFLCHELSERFDLAHGRLELRPMPTLLHQLLVLYLLNRLNEWAGPRGRGVALPSPLPVRIPDHGLRHPDVLLVRSAHVVGFKRPLDGADLAVEVVSEGAENRARDEQIKPREYALAGIPEYWIVDPEQRIIQRLVLSAGDYTIADVLREGDTLTSPLLPDFTLSVIDLFRAGETLPGG